MSIISREELRELALRPDGWAVSAFMPAHRAGPEIQQDRIRLKNLLNEAEERLLEAGVRRPDAGDLLGPARDLLADEPFWRHQSDGLAVFAGPALVRAYRVPLSLDEHVIVGRYYHVKPLLPLISGNGCFYILAISQNKVRLLEATRENVDEIEVEGLSGGLKELILKYEEATADVDWHTRTASQHSGERAAVFHGHGGIEDERKDQILRYLQKVDKAIHPHLMGRDAPLVVAAVDYLIPIYREANNYPHLAAEGVEGNPDEWRPKELHERAWPLVEPLFERAQEEAAARYRELEGTGQTSKRADEIVPAAYHGRVEALFVARGRHRYGAFDPQGGGVHFEEEPGPDNQDLLDLAAIHTFLNGGAVYAVPPEEVPSGESLAATFRY